MGKKKSNFICQNEKLNKIVLQRCFKYTNGSEITMKYLCRSTYGSLKLHEEYVTSEHNLFKTYRTPHFGESLWAHSMSYSSSQSLLLLRQHLVVHLWNMLSYILHGPISKQSVKNESFQGMSSPESFFCLDTTLLKTTCKTNSSDISLCHTACMGIYSRK